MLTLLHPAITHLVASYPIGMYAVASGGSPILLFKLSKEAILAAKLRNQFKIYLYYYELRNQRIIVLISAFFDDHDEPLMLQTPIIDDLDSGNIRAALASDQISIHFFDEQCRELLGWRAAIECSPEIRHILEEEIVSNFNMDTCRQACDLARSAFSCRDLQVDQKAIVIQMEESLVPEDLVILDARPAMHSYKGSKQSTLSMLERQEPGPFQEHDLAVMLGRVFNPDQVYRGPLRDYDKEEIADIVIVTESMVMFVQAKDSPNTEATLKQDIERKKATSKKHLRKAVGQMRGAWRYAKRDRILRMLIEGEVHDIELGDREVCGLVVVRELFNDQYQYYSEQVLQVVQEFGWRCIPLDFTEVHMYAMHMQNEDAFLEAYERVFSVGLQNEEFPRLRFGLTL